VTTKNVTVAIVGKDQPFTILEGDTLAPFISQLDADQPGDDGDAGDGDAAVPMET
jgi:hypothetical protein